MEGCLSYQKWMIYVRYGGIFPLFDGKWASERENRLLIGDLSPPCRFSLHPPSMTMHPICRPPSSFLPTRLDLERIRDRVDKDFERRRSSLIVGLSHTVSPAAPAGASRPQKPRRSATKEEKVGGGGGGVGERVVVDPRHRDRVRGRRRWEEVVVGVGV